MKTISHLRKSLPEIRRTYCGAAATVQDVYFWEHIPDFLSLCQNCVDAKQDEKEDRAR